MQARKTARYTDKRERILAAAGESLAREGLQGLDLAVVAEAIGLRRSSLTYYFANVEDLAAAVLERTIAELREQVRHAAAHSSLEERLVALFRAEAEVYFGWQEGTGSRRQQLGEIRALKSDHRKHLGQHYAALVRDVAQMLAGHANDEQQVSDRELLAAQLVLENLFWLPAWLGFYHHWEAERVLEQVVDNLLHGIAADPLSLDGPVLAVESAEDTGEVSLQAYLRVATRLVCERGYRGASIDRIASELNVTKGSFYHHIAMKDDLVEVCFERSYDRLAQFQRKAEEDTASAGEALMLVLRSVISTQFEGEIPFLRSSALVGMESGLRARVIERSQRAIRWFASQLGSAMREGDIRPGDTLVAAQMLYIAGNSAFDVPRLIRSEKHALEQDYLQMAMCGIKQHLSASAGKSS